MSVGFTLAVSNSSVVFGQPFNLIATFYNSGASSVTVSELYSSSSLLSGQYPNLQAEQGGGLLVPAASGGVPGNASVAWPMCMVGNDPMNAPVTMSALLNDNVTIVVSEEILIRAVNSIGPQVSQSPQPQVQNVPPQPYGTADFTSNYNSAIAAVVASH